MKIKVTKRDYKEVEQLPVRPHKLPKKPSPLFRTLMTTLSKADLKATHFTYREIGMEKLGKDEPCMILMNHSSFIDLEIASTIFKDRPFNIICTSDGFVGKEGLMRAIGCIPTQKFVMEVSLIKDMKYTLEHLKSSVLMYPEASYTFDGTATPLPESVGKCLKVLKVPVIMVRTYGAFHRDPLYNNLQKRQVDVSAEVTYLLSPEDLKEKSAKEINEILKEQFGFDNFKWQQEQQIRITEPFRADFLNRVLYKCPHCNQEGHMHGEGIKLVCSHCQNSYELTEEGWMKHHQNLPKFEHIPDWYEWERACVRKEIEEGTYSLDIPVDIYILKDFKSIYQVGSGNLAHNNQGFHLRGCDGAIDFVQTPETSYGLYADYNWYEIGDMICIGNSEVLYYCFPKTTEDVVAKARLATEEMFIMARNNRQKQNIG